MLLDLLRAAFPAAPLPARLKCGQWKLSTNWSRSDATPGAVASVIWSFCGKMDTSITIRTVTATQGQLYCSAGGGIVADSNEEAEYQETFDKVNRILHPLEN